MRRKTKKLTPSMLRKIVVEETKRARRSRKMRESLSGELEPVEKVTPTEVDADEHGKSVALEKDIDHAKALKVEEARLIRKIKRIREARTRVRSRIAKRL
jgi:hypothetical protein